MSRDRKIRVLVAKVGLDGHDVGARVVARGLLDAGMEVIYTGLRRTPEQIVRAAIDEDVDVIGVSILSGAHVVLMEKVWELLKQHDATDIMVVVGGVIPPEDFPRLEKAGVRKVFVSGTAVSDIADYLNAAFAGGMA